MAALELNISCPNVSGGVDFGTDPAMCEKVVARRSPGVPHARPGQAHAERDGHRLDRRRRPRRAAPTPISLINTCLGMAIDWRRRRPRLGNVLGGLSGPAIKPIALRAVYQAAEAVAHSDRGNRRDRRRSTT